MTEYTSEQVRDLIPQREPMVMIDGMKYDNTSFYTTLTIRANNFFIAGDTLIEAGLVEHTAQSAAARVGLQAQAYAEAPHIGYIGEVKYFTIHRLPHIGETLQTEIQIVTVAEPITVVESLTMAGNDMIATGKLKVFITNE